MLIERSIYDKYRFERDLQDLKKSFILATTIHPYLAYDSEDFLRYTIRIRGGDYFLENCFGNDIQSRVTLINAIFDFIFKDNCSVNNINNILLYNICDLIICAKTEDQILTIIANLNTYFKFDYSNESLLYMYIGLNYVRYLNLNHFYNSIRNNIIHTLIKNRTNTNYIKRNRNYLSNFETDLSFYISEIALI